MVTMETKIIEEEVLVNEIALTLAMYLPTNYSLARVRILAQEVYDKDVLPALKDSWTYGKRGIPIS